VIDSDRRFSAEGDTNLLAEAGMQLGFHRPRQGGFFIYMDEDDVHEGNPNESYLAASLR
jgi:hypothetical protein